MNRFERDSKLPILKLAIPLLAALAYSPATTLAAPILGSDLASFAVLGGSAVTNTGATTLTGQLGANPNLAITGQSTITINGQPALTTGASFVHTGDAVAALAQSQLTTARTNLGLMGAGTSLGTDLAGLTISPGVYTVSAGTSNLTGAVTLDGGGNANAIWVFQMPSTLITSPGSVVNVINTGSGAGVYWNVGSSATLDTSTLFAGNILALSSITLNSSAQILCGRALANTGAVTLGANTISNDCNVFNGGTTRTDYSSSGFNAQVAAVPIPAALWLFGSGLIGLIGISRRTPSAVA